LVMMASFGWDSSMVIQSPMEGGYPLPYFLGKVQITSNLAADYRAKVSLFKMLELKYLRQRAYGRL